MAEGADGGAASACRIAYTICSSENFDHFIGPLLSPRIPDTNLLYFQTVVVFRGDIAMGKIGQTRYGSLGGVRICIIQERVRDETGQLLYLCKVVRPFVTFSPKLLHHQI